MLRNPEFTTWSIILWVPICVLLYPTQPMGNKWFVSPRWSIRCRRRFLHAPLHRTFYLRIDSFKFDFRKLLVVVELLDGFLTLCNVKSPVRTREEEKKVTVSSRWPVRLNLIRKLVWLRFRWRVAWLAGRSDIVLGREYSGRGRFTWFVVTVSSK